MSTPLQPDPDAVCEACGCFGAFRFDGETLCAECYAGRGSCCSAEFSGRDPDGDRGRTHATSDRPPRCDAASARPSLAN